VVTLSVKTGSISGILSILSTPVPVPGVGHRAECAPSGLGTGSAYAFVSTIDSDDQLFIFSPTCAIAARFAEVAYSKLG
jgi:hypothetical protein